MTTISLQVQQPQRKWPGKRPLRVALVGNPNCGKTTLFNRLTGLRAKTSNFPGTTVEHRKGKLTLGDEEIDLVDLPGLYSTEFGQSEELLASAVLRGGLPGMERPDAVIVIIDATCLARHLYLASEVREMGVPMVVALNMIDEARKQGLTICLETLGKELDATIVPVSGRTGEGIGQLRDAIADDLAGDEEVHATRAAGMTDRLACSACSSTHNAGRGSPPRARIVAWAVGDQGSPYNRRNSRVAASKMSVIDDRDGVANRARQPPISANCWPCNTTCSADTAPWCRPWA